MFNLGAIYPHQMGDIKLIEGAQRMITGIKELCYQDRFNVMKLKLTTLETRRIRGELIVVT